MVTATKNTIAALLPVTIRPVTMVTNAKIKAYNEIKITNADFVVISVRAQSTGELTQPHAEYGRKKRDAAANDKLQERVTHIWQYRF